MMRNPMRRNMTVATILTNVFVSLIFVFSLGCTKKQQQSSETSKKSSQQNLETNDTILIGAVLSLTGPEATFGISTKNAIELSFEQKNKEGGVLGKKLKLITLDNQSKPEESAIAITKLITQDNVVAVLGEVASSRSIAMAPIAQSNKIPMLSTASTNPKVTELGDFIFRTSFIDPFQGPVLARFVFENLKMKKVAIFKDVKNDYSIGLSQFFKEKFVELGGQIISEQSYSAGDMDFKAQLTAIRSAKPEFVYLPGYYTDVGLILRQARELGIKVPFGGGDGWDSPKLFEIGGKATEGGYFSNHYSPEAEDPFVQSFVKEYEAKYGTVPDALAALGYDSGIIMIEALKNSKSLAGTDIRDALAKTSKIKGVTGIITFNSQRNPIKSAVIIKIEDGKQKYVTTIDPS
ncbi:MAG: ABC transporter substrate-binding protein [Bdellovibrionales bacterium]|nr:ABC transporter substrate-binding protein [Bdellovibrionales bacterium]